MTDTPYLTIDLPRVDANLSSMARHCAELGVTLRPHAKTHKCIELARRQIDSGAAGLTVATIGEAEVFAAAAERTGCRDLFIAYPLWVTEHKGARMRALAQTVSLRVGIDSVAGARRLAAEVVRPGVIVEAIIEVDSGHHRTGVPPEDAGTVAAAAATAGLDVVGVFTFPGHGYGPAAARAEAATAEADALHKASESLRANGIGPRVISGGSTPTVGFARPGLLTELRPGVYLFNDAQQVELGSAGFDDVALTAVTAVVHRAGRQVVVDAGSKILGADRPAWASGFGRVIDTPQARITALSEHHATLEYPADATPAAVPDVGATVRVIPNHVCSAVNLVDELVVHTATGEPLSWPVAARGANS
ncbi:alanine racemase [Gordonia sp. DT30]|uniref:alanine racemase n=1 Tax=unclassified Gordonia (in: high G+C Gram-positive bacteria) TaxID=2657482 RepID=UPI003CF10655